jgi:hypothetical protein
VQLVLPRVQLAPGEEPACRSVRDVHMMQMNVPWDIYMHVVVVVVRSLSRI